jgi:predicted DNA-binding ribbon-helix-helix protein
VPNPEAEASGPAGTAVRKRSVTIAGHRTSFSLEEAFWRALKDQARAEGLSLAALIEKIDRDRQGNLSSAVRVYLLERLQEGESKQSQA